MYHALNVRVINLNLYQNVRDVMRWKFRNVHHDILNKKRIPNGELKKYLGILNLNEGCSLSDVRASYIELAKQYHPDGGTTTADAQKFAEVKEAYKVLKEQFNDGLQNDDKSEECVENDYDIKHVAPQHRQYLSYEGVGYGTMAQRRRHYDSYKVSKAVDAVQEHRTQQLMNEDKNSLVVRDKKAAKNHKIRNAIERLVEDLIQESMAKGDFENLPGKGKPLQYSSHNPYIDTVTQKLNEVLITNGFIPQWILLEKEIRMDTALLKEKLKSIRCTFGPAPLTDKEMFEWSRMLTTLETDVKSLNVKINNYNLLVPLLEKQLVNFQLEREAGKILENGVTRSDTAERVKDLKEKTATYHSTTNDGSILDVFFKIFR